MSPCVQILNLLLITERIKSILPIPQSILVKQGKSQLSEDLLTLFQPGVTIYAGKVGGFFHRLMQLQVIRKLGKKDLLYFFVRPSSSLVFLG